MHTSFMRRALDKDINVQCGMDCSCTFVEMHGIKLYNTTYNTLNIRSHVLRPYTEGVVARQCTSVVLCMAK